jgi:hypothetical protein
MTTTPHTLPQLADIGAAAASSKIGGPDLTVFSGASCYPRDAPAREAFAKAVLDAVGYKFPVDPERETFDAWYESAQIPQGEAQAFAAWKAGRDELRKAQMLDKEPSQPENDGWIEWSGGKCPVDSNVKVAVRYRFLVESDVSQAENFHWNHIGHQYDIIAYKIIPQTTTK